MICEMPMLESMQWQFCHAVEAQCIGMVDEQHQAVKAEDMSNNPGPSTVESTPGALTQMCDGEAYVDGAEGPVIIATDLPEGFVISDGTIHLQLTLKLTAGADEEYRTHLLSIRLHLNKAPLCPNSSKVNASWSAAEQAAAKLSLRSQVRLDSLTANAQSKPM